MMMVKLTVMMMMMMMMMMMIPVAVWEFLGISRCCSSNVGLLDKTLLKGYLGAIGLLSLL